LNEQILIPPKVERGVLFEMAARNIPTIHLLYIKGLTLKYGLPWDPIPLPDLKDFELFDMTSSLTIRFWTIAIIYWAILIILFIFGIKSNHSPTDR
ncbi:MAG: hypothetical protein JSW07_22290, partial [bacterium]